MADEERRSDKEGTQRKMPRRVVRPGQEIRKGASRVQLDPTAQAHIGKQLKDIYDDVVNQPIPDRFTELLKRIDRQGPALGKQDDPIEDD